MGLRAASKEPLEGNGWVRGYFFPLEEALAFPCLHPVCSAEARACAPRGGRTSLSILHQYGDWAVVPLGTPEPGTCRAPLATKPCSPGLDMLPPLRGALPVGRVLPARLPLCVSGSWATLQSCSPAMR